MGSTDLPIAALTAGAVALLLFATLLTLVAVVLSRRRSRRQSQFQFKTQSEFPSPLSEEKRVDATLDTLQPIDVPPRAQPLEETVMMAIARAEQDGRTSDLPGLYLTLAREHMTQGAHKEASDLLRKSLRAAAALGQKQVQAGARLELGDLAHSSGDLTTACEHWQIARGLFTELQQRGDHAAIEKRMARNGCPTDWVLNDF